MVFACGREEERPSAATRMGQALGAERDALARGLGSHSSPSRVPLLHLAGPEYKDSSATGSPLCSQVLAEDLWGRREEPTFFILQNTVSLGRPAQLCSRTLCQPGEVQGPCRAASHSTQQDWPSLLLRNSQSAGPGRLPSMFVQAIRECVLKKATNGNRALLMNTWNDPEGGQARTEQDKACKRQPDYLQGPVIPEIITLSPLMERTSCLAFITMESGLFVS